MDGAKIVEYGLKAIVLLLDLGFFLCFILFQIASWAEFRHNRKVKQEGVETDRSVTLLWFLISIASGLISIVLSGLVLMPWWT